MAEMSGADICSFLINKSGISVDDLESKPSEMMYDADPTKTLCEYMMFQEGISIHDLKKQGSQQDGFRRRDKSEHSNNNNKKQMVLGAMKRFKLEEIKAATNNFSDKCLIGTGGIGKLYRGKLFHSEGKTEAAVKRLDLKFGQFWNEVRMLSEYKHTNIVSPLGYCDDSDEQIIVYEYATKRSLDQYLDSSGLSWARRLQICIGAAHGLEYLHDAARTTHQRILHRDIKSSNILLDENWTAKISDFGLSKISLANQGNSYGTQAYVDPFYVETGLLTKESDVYSFGVVLFEVLCGRSCFGYRDDRSQPLIRLARQSYKQNGVQEIIFGNLKDEINRHSLQVFATIAYQCLESKREERPTMPEVLTALETALQYQETKPSSFSSTSPSHPSSSIQVFPLCHQFDISELRLATQNFDESLIIGEGGFAKAYKADVIIGSSKRVVAIKRLGPTSNQGAKEFYAQLEMLSKLRHRNVVPLIGYCNYREEMIFVYEYMPNGTLADHLHELGTPLSWIQRLKICIGTARGLHYLHGGIGNEAGIIHQVVNGFNILLSESWEPKIAGFHLAMACPRNDQALNYVNTSVSGTFGYLDPDYFATGNLTMKSDVYAFGVVLLEVLCRKRAVDRSLDEHLVSWAKDFIKKGKLKQICDFDISNQIAPKCLKEFGRIAERCLHHNPKERCTMAEVLFSLESLLIIQEKYNDSLQPAVRRKFGKPVKKSA